MEAFNRYELLMLTTPEITQDETKELEKQLSNLIKTRNGSVIAFDRWGKYRLAYPVNHNDYGVYFLIRFEVDAENKEALLKAIKDVFVFKFNTLIPKHIVERIDAQGSMEYKRPASLEDNPQDVDMFLKRNEM